MAHAQVKFNTTVSADLGVIVTAEATGGHIVLNAVVTEARDGSRIEVPWGWLSEETQKQLRREAIEALRQVAHGAIKEGV